MVHTLQSIHSNSSLAAIQSGGVRFIAAFVLLMSSSAFAQAGESTKPVSLVCNPNAVAGVSEGDMVASGFQMLEHAMRGKRMDMERTSAFGEFDALLTSSYGLRNPLATLANPLARKRMEDVSQLVVSGYVVAAQMMQGVMIKEGVVPRETLKIVGNMVYSALEPDGEDPALGDIDTKVRSADNELTKIGVDRRPFARWLIRAYAYNDPVAVDAALAGYCAAKPTTDESKLLTKTAKRVRLDPAKIVVAKP
jgi:hypothetical protein